MTEGYNPFNAPTTAPAPGAVIEIPTYPSIRAWSYSVVQQHDKCPLAVRYRKIDRIPEPDNEHQARGRKIHDELKHLVQTGGFPEGATIPHRDVWFTRLMHLHAAGAIAEQQLAFNKAWEKVQWYGANVWARIVMDAMLVLPDIIRVHEFKTGKVWPEHEKQKRLYALAALKLNPDHDVVVVGCDYIDLPDQADDLTKFTRAQELSLEQEFADFAAPLLSETIFPAKAGTHCNWCHFRRSNAGPCAFG
jgi:CRISPR/Cas system-associated exonuclease Cas4 (RecB family)